MIDGVPAAAVAEAEREWKAVRERAGFEGERLPGSAGLQHSHWDWDRKHRSTKGLLAYRMLGIECNGQMQGLMLLKMAGCNARLPEQAGKDLVYVDYIEAAPWNLKSVVAQPRFGLVGVVLIAAAIQSSKENGFKGRIGLHSLGQAEAFYRDKCRMTELGGDPEKQDLVYFEMNAAQADKFVR